MEYKEIPLVEEYNQQGLMLFSAGKYLQALEKYRMAEKAEPMYSETYKHIGETYIIIDDYANARKAFQKLLLIDKKNGEAYFHLGNVEFLQGNNAKGKECYAKAMANKYLTAELYMNLASVEEDENEPEEALMHYSKAIAKDKTMAEAHLRKAMIYRNLGRVKEALTALNTMIDCVPDIFEGYHFKIMINLEVGDFEKARKTLDKALSMFPDDIGFIYDNVIYLEKMDKFDEALKAIEIQLANGYDREFTMEKARILGMQNRIDESLALLEQVEINSETPDSEANFLMLNIYLSREQYHSAFDNCQKLLDIEDDSVYYYSAIYYKAYCIEKVQGIEAAKESYEEAIKEFRFASSKHPEMMDLILYRALCYRAVKNADKAMEMVNYMLAINENIAEAYLLRADLYEEQGAVGKAKKDRALALSLRNVT